MKNHTYTITCAYTHDADSNIPDVTPLSFDAHLHENIFHIMEKLQEKETIPTQDVPAFILGLKLFGEVILRNKDQALCARLKPHMVTIMQEIKQS